MTTELRYTQLNFLEHEDQLRKVWKQDTILKSLSWKVLNQLMQLDDTDFDLKTEFNNKAPTLNTLHEWMTKKNKGLAGKIRISEKQLIHLLSICKSKTKKNITSKKRGTHNKKGSVIKKKKTQKKSFFSFLF